MVLNEMKELPVATLAIYNITSVLQGLAAKHIPKYRKVRILDRDMLIKKYVSKCLLKTGQFLIKEIFPKFQIPFNIFEENHIKSKFSCLMAMVYANSSFTLA